MANQTSDDDIASSSVTIPDEERELEPPAQVQEEEVEEVHENTVADDGDVGEQAKSQVASDNDDTIDNPADATTSLPTMVNSSLAAQLRSSRPSRRSTRNISATSHSSIDDHEKGEGAHHANGNSVRSLNSGVDTSNNAAMTVGKTNTAASTSSTPGAFSMSAPNDGSNSSSRSSSRRLKQSVITDKMSPSSSRRILRAQSRQKHQEELQENNGNQQQKGDDGGLSTGRILDLTRFNRQTTAADSAADSNHANGGFDGSSHLADEISINHEDRPANDENFDLERAQRDRIQDSARPQVPPTPTQQLSSASTPPAAGFPGQGGPPSTTYDDLISAHLVLENSRRHEEASSNRGSNDEVVYHAEAVPSTRQLSKNFTRGACVIAVIVVIVIIVLLSINLRVAGSNRDNAIDIDDYNATSANVLPNVVFNPLGSTLSSNTNFGIDTGFGTSIDMCSGGDYDGNETQILLKLIVGESAPQSEKDRVRVYGYMKRDINDALSSSLPHGTSQMDWIQIGSDLIGDSPDDAFGKSVAISSIAESLSDGSKTTTTIVACSAPEKTTGGGIQSGMVRMYRYNTLDQDWVRMGDDLVGSLDFEHFGSQIELSDDGKVTAVLSEKTGRVNLYRWDGDGDAWISLPPLPLQNEMNDFMGDTISLSGDGLVVAVGSTSYAGSTGQVVVYCFNEYFKEWKILGVGSDVSENSEVATVAALNGRSQGDAFGTSISLTWDGSCVAIGAKQNGRLFVPGAGYVHVYCLENNVDIADDANWVLLGNSDDMLGDKVGFGSSVSLVLPASAEDKNALVVAIGAPQAGYVSFFQYQNRSWAHRGKLLQGYDKDDQFGSSLSLSTFNTDSQGDKGFALAVGAPFGNSRDSRGKSRESGHVRMFQMLKADDTIDLQISHSTDNESALQNPNSLNENILHYSSIASGLQQLAVKEGMYPVHLLAGDAFLPNVFFESSSEVPEYGSPGIGEVLIYNAMNINGLAIGIWELGEGLDIFATLLNRANFPFLSVNYDFSNVELRNNTPGIEIAPDASNCEDALGKVVRSCYYDYGAFRVGLIGTSPPEIWTEDLPGLAVGGGEEGAGGGHESLREQIQNQADLLTKFGVHIIILIDRVERYGDFQNEIRQYSKIDIVVTDAAGNGLSAGKEKSNGPFNFIDGSSDYVQITGEYPRFGEDRNGAPALLIDTQGKNGFVGNLMVKFNLEGHLVDWDGLRSGPISTTQTATKLMEDVLDTVEQVQVSEVQDVLDNLTQTPSIISAFVMVGSTNSPLLEPFALARETNLSRLIADALLWEARRVLSTSSIIAFTNIGGIRDDISGPNIIRLSIQSCLPFNNGIVILEVTFGQLLASMENGVSTGDGVSGRYPTVSGIKFEFDISKPGLKGEELVTEPSRIKSLIILSQDDDEEEVLIADFTVVDGVLDRTFTVATISYLAGGGDQMFGFEAATEIQQLDNREQNILEDYIAIELGGIVDITDPPTDPRVVRLG